MPYKFNESRRHHIKKPTYKVNNWREYNESLKNRGSLTLWFNEEGIKHWYAKPNGKACGQKTYSNSAIETAATLRLLFKLPYRQTTGLLASITELMNIKLRIPNFSTLSRRLSKLSIRLNKPSLHKSGTHIIIDGSGLSVHGAKELYDIKGKLLEKRGYRRLHIAINEHQEITACELTTLHGNEVKQVPKLLRKIKDHCTTFMADKNYDAKSVYKAIEKYRPTHFIRKVKHDTYRVVIPPHRNAVIRTQKNHYLLERSQHASYIKEHGVLKWQKKNGYGLRSLVEVAFSRYKRIVGTVMQGITLENQQVEARLACKALNTMLSLGMPQSTKVI